MENKVICPVCGETAELMEIMGYEQPSGDRDVPPTFIETGERYVCPGCGKEFYV